MTTTVSAPGLDALPGALHNAADAMSKLPPDATTQAAHVIASAAARIAPRRTGRLAGSLRGTTVEFTPTIESDLAYASVIHWGSRNRNIRPNPFIMRAADQTTEQWSDAYAQGVQTVLDAVAAHVSDH
jgi:hypothetical protein